MLSDPRDARTWNGSLRQIIDSIKGGSALWIYYPDEEWLEESEFLDGE